MQSGKSAGKAAPGARIGALDGLRALAIAAIVAIHLLGIAGVLFPGRDDFTARLIWTSIGGTIDLFFVLSGFLLCTTIDWPPGPLRSASAFS